MPNPFSDPRYGMRGFSASRAAATNRPEPITPVVESYAGVNETWRGIEDHGVKPEYDPADPETNTVDINGRPVVFDYEQAPLIQEPVPVRIVQEAGREFRTFWTDRVTLSTGISSLLGRDDRRVKALIINTDAAKTVWVASSTADLVQRGYPLGPGKELNISGEMPVYAVATDGSGVIVGLYVETTVPEDTRSK